MANSNKTVVAIGKFDGVHIGHQKLFQVAFKISKEKNIKSTALVIESSGQRLVSPECREVLIKSCGIDEITIQNLTNDFMNMSAEQFVSDYLCAGLNCDHVVVGYNFRFAKGRKATAEDLKNICAKKNIGCTIVSEVSVTVDNKSIAASSSAVRELLLAGDVEASKKVLGRPYILAGEVVHGREIGRTINIPTANLNLAKDCVLPKNGVYSTKVNINGKIYDSITNIGANPTVSCEDKITAETHIIDFSGNIYGKEMTVEFIKRIRDEKRFSSLEELKKQIQSDINKAKN